jgi:hypothetical protein
MRNAAHNKGISDPSASASVAFHLARFALRSRDAVLMIRLALRSSIFAASQARGYRADDPRDIFGRNGFSLCHCPLLLLSTPSIALTACGLTGCSPSVNSKPRLLEGAADRLCRLGLRLRRALSCAPSAPGAARNREAVASIRS